MAQSIEMLIGGMSADIKNIEKSLSAQAVSRKEQYKAIEEIKAAQDKINHSLDVLQDDINKMKQPVSDFKKFRERLKGAIFLATCAGGSLGAFLTGFYEWFKK